MIINNAELDLDSQVFPAVLTVQLLCQIFKKAQNSLVFVQF